MIFMKIRTEQGHINFSSIKDAFRKGDGGEVSKAADVVMGRKGWTFMQRDLAKHALGAAVALIGYAAVPATVAMMSSSPTPASTTTTTTAPAATTAPPAPTTTAPHGTTTTTRTEPKGATTTTGAQRGTTITTKPTTTTTQPPSTTTTQPPSTTTTQPPSTTTTQPPSTTTTTTAPPATTTTTTTVPLQTTQPTVSTPSGTNQVTAGQSFTLTEPTPTGGTAPYTYQWYVKVPNSSGFAPANSVCDNAQSSICQVSNTTAYNGPYTFYIKVTDSAGQTASNENNPVTVNVLPNITIPS